MEITMELVFQGLPTQVVVVVEVDMMVVEEMEVQAVQA